MPPFSASFFIFNAGECECRSSAAGTAGRCEVQPRLRRRIIKPMQTRRLAAFALLALASVRTEAAAASFVPICDLGSGTYRGFAGGLYEGGSNLPPADHLAAGLAATARVRPLDASGVPSATGKIVMLSVGMSNTTQEFCAAANPAPCDAWSFVGQATADPAVNHTQLVLVNGAAGGQTTSTWDTPAAANYDRVRQLDLSPAGLTEAQVQLAWVKQANPGPTRALPDPGADAYVLEAGLGNVIRAMKVRYPNLQIVYLSSRIYAGYATSTLNPEPYAYETGYSVKWLVQAQINQARNAGTVTDARAGDLRIGPTAPWIAWGPYLWADGLNPRSDGLTWSASEFSSDGTHPATPARQKVGKLLLDFLANDPTSRGWFLAGPPAPRRRGARH